MRLALLSLLLLFVSGYKAIGQPNVLATWPVGVPLCYLSFLDDGTYRVDTTGLWQPYRHTFNPAFMPDSANGILFQCNGHLVANRLGQIIDNGDKLTDSIFYSGYYNRGNTITQSTVALPKKNNTYWIFYYSYSDSLFWSGEGSPDRLYYALVDMNANNGAGKVIQKKIPVYKGIMGDCRLTAVKHANGKDWWLVNHGYTNDVYNKFLVTEDTVLGPFIQHIGEPDAEPDIDGGAQFSMDGTKYANGTIASPMNLMDFDRCTGMFSNVRSISAYAELPWTPSDSNSVVDGLCFSPNGRYLYVTSLKYLLQYDTWATPVEDSRVLIAKVDSTYNNTEPFYSLFVSPHNKIIVSNFQGLPSFSYYHTIESPDSAGLACDFRKRSLIIPSSLSDNTLPNVINLQLAALPDGACDTAVTAIPNDNAQSEGDFMVKVFPNPSANLVFVESTDKEVVGTLTVTDALGRMQYSNNTFEQATVVKVKDWQNGIYFWCITSANGKAMYGKFLVQH